MKVHVTDHAILRYLERGCGFDIELVRAKIKDLVLPAAAVGASNIVIGDLRFCFVEHADKNIQVTTVMNADMAVNHKQSRQRTAEKISTFRENMVNSRRDYKKLRRAK
jgi:hypothetical protein